MLPSLEQHVSSTNDSIGKECTPETHPFRIIFVGMTNEIEVTNKPHRIDEPYLQNAEIIRDFMQDFFGQDTGSSLVQVQRALGHSTST